MISVERAAENELDAELINEEAYEKYVRTTWSRSTRRLTTRCGLRYASCTRTQSFLLVKAGAKKGTLVRCYFGDDAADGISW